MVSSILNPGVFEPDFRPIIGALLIITIPIVFILIKHWDYFKNEFYSDWE